MKNFTRTLFLAMAIALVQGLTSCNEPKEVRIPADGQSIKVDGSAKEYFKVTEGGIIKCDNNVLTVTVTVRKAKTVDKSKYTSIKVCGTDGEISDPQLALTDAEGTLVRGGLMHLADPASQQKLADMLTDNSTNELRVKFTTNELTDEEISTIMREVVSAELRSDVDMLEVKTNYGYHTNMSSTPGAYAPTVRVNGVNVRLRWSPSYNGAIYANSYGVPIYPTKGALLTCTGVQGDWYQVVVNGNTLYINRYYASPVY